MHSHPFKLDTMGYIAWSLFVISLMVVAGESAKIRWAEDSNCVDLINQIGADGTNKLKMPTRTNQNMYYRCVFGQKMPFTCPEDMVFSSHLNVCDDPPTLSNGKNPAQEYGDEEREDKNDEDKEEDIDERENSETKHEDENEEKADDETKRQRHRVKEEERQDENEENEQPRRENEERPHDEEKDETEQLHRANEEENEEIHERPRVVEKDKKNRSHHVTEQENEDTLERPRAEEKNRKEQPHRENQEENEDTHERPRAEEKESPHRANEEGKYENNENDDVPQRVVSNEENEEDETVARITTVEAVETTKKPDVVTTQAPVATTVVVDVATTDTITTTTKKPKNVALRKKQNRRRGKRPMKKIPAISADEMGNDIYKIKEDAIKKDSGEIVRETSVKNGDSIATTKVVIDEEPPVPNGTGRASDVVVKKPTVPETKPAKPTVAKQKGNSQNADTTARQQGDPRPIRPALTNLVRNLLRDVIGE